MDDTATDAVLANRRCWCPVCGQSHEAVVDDECRVMDTGELVYPHLACALQRYYDEAKRRKM